jgi:methionyl-tRNA formyltransferase
MQPLTSLRVVFFGTPDFAVASLNALIESGVQVVAVVTAPDKPSGRGLQVHGTPVKLAAEAAGIKVLQPVKLKDPEFLESLRALNADVFVVVAFRMLPEVVWNMPPMGTINVHASLLPQFRGAAPINWAIIEGEKKTGVTTFRLKHEIDTGDWLLQDEVEILPEDNAGTLHDKLMNAGANLLPRTLDGLLNDTLQPKPQEYHSEMKHAPRIFKDDMQMDWKKSADSLRNFVRGLSPYPTAITKLTEKNLKVYSAHAAQEAHSAEPGAVDTDGKSYLRMAASDGWLYLDEIQIEGKKRMPVKEFLKGFRQ